MRDIINGKKAIYIVERINDIGDYRVTIYGHNTIKNGTSCLTGKFDYQSIIDRIEQGRKVLL